MKNKIKISVTALVFIIIFMSCQHQRSDMGNSNSNLFNMGYVANDDQNIYFCALTEGNSGIYKADLDGSNKTLLCNEHGFYINIIDNWIYFVNSIDNKIYRMDKEGGNKLKISDIEATSLLAYKNKLYVIGVYEPYGCNLFVMNLDGTEEINICEEYVGDISIYNNRIYYTYITEDNEGYLCSMDIDGNNKETLLDDSPIRFFPTEKNIYYIITQEKKKMDMSLILANSEVFDEKNGDLYFTSIDLLGRTSFKRYNAVTDDLKVITNKKCEYVNLMGNKILYFEDNVLFWMETTGKNIRRFPCL